MSFYLCIFVICFQIIFVSKCIHTQFIFDTISTCEYQVNNEHVILNSHIWNISYSNKNIIFTLCGDRLKTYLGNGSKESTAVIYDRKQPGKPIDAGSYFEVDRHFYLNNEIVPKHQKLPFVLSSQGGSICADNTSSKHSLIITIDMRTSDKKEAIIVNNIDNCTYNLTIKPNVEPYCTKLFRGNLIDFRPLKGKEFIIESKDSKFLLSLCGNAKSCGKDGVSACQILNGTIKHIASINPEIKYDSGNIVVTSKWQNVKTLYKINCNWNTDELSGRYILPPTKGKRYKFELESVYGCIKYPMKCWIRDDENYLYDLSSLNREQGWKVSNFTNGNFLVNICGPLKTKDSKCTSQYSQACFYNKETSLNYGSILETLYVEDNMVVAKFIGGDICPSNNQMKLSTIIFFECDWNEDGPNLVNMHDCSMEIHWKTPAACPKYINRYENCHINDLYGERNLNSLYRESDRNHTIDKRTYLRYNICGKLRNSCNNESQVSACLHADGEEYVIAYLKTSVEVNHTDIYMKLTGEYCKYKTYKRNIRINFYCNYEYNREHLAKLNVIEDACSYVLDIHTSAACSSTNKVNCIAQDNKNIYNLTYLALKNKNYIINTEKYDFIFNLCNPIVMIDDTLCLMDVGACLRNKTEPNIKKRFISYGKPNNFNVNSKNITFKYVNGKLCYETMFDKRASITFSCSNDIADIKLNEINSCNFEILWKTNLVCLQRKIRNEKSCIYKTDKQKMVDLSAIDEKKLRLNFDDKTIVTLELCKNTYLNETTNEDAYELDATVELIEKWDRYYLKYEMKQSCNTKDVVIIEIHLECRTDYGETTYKYVSNSDCIYKIILQSVSLCNSTLSAVQRKVFNDYNCIVGNSDKFLNLTSFTSLKVNDVTINLEYTHCPSIINDCKDSALKFTYTNNTKKCLDGYYIYDVWLKCNTSLEMPSITNMSICHSRVIYPTNDACLVSSCYTHTAGIVSGVFVGIAALIIFGTTIYLYCRKQRKYSSFNKEETPIYMRNTSL